MSRNLASFHISSNHNLNSPPDCLVGMCICCFKCKYHAFRNGPQLYGVRYRTHLSCMFALISRACTHLYHHLSVHSEICIIEALFFILGSTIMYCGPSAEKMAVCPSPQERSSQPFPTLTPRGRQNIKDAFRNRGTKQHKLPSSS